MKSLATKIEKLKDEDADEHFNGLQASHEERARAEAYFILGRIKQNEHIGEAIHANLSAQTILALQRFQQEKKHEVFGFDTFDKFLNESPYSPMTKAQYYDRLAIVNRHGIDVADLLTSVGISMRSQKLLAKGDIEVKQGTIFIAGQEIESSGDVKELVIELVNDRRKLEEQNAKLNSALEKEKETVRRGTDENEELRRNLDAMNETPRFQRALMRAVNAQLLLVEAIGELDDGEKKARGPEDLKLFAEQYFRISEAYGVRRSLTDAMPAGDSVADRVIAEMIEDGSFDELD